MNTEELNYYKAAASLGLIPDEENPIFIFGMTHTDLLVDIVKGKIDMVELARHELWARGLNEKGKFVGWQSNLSLK
jgi:hypothetical protein